MASLYIKDSETAALASEVAAELGTTKTEAVKRGLRSIQPVTTNVAKGSTAEWLRAYRRARPLPNLEKMRADKAFFDELSGEEDIFDPWAP